MRWGATIRRSSAERVEEAFAALAAGADVALGPAHDGGYYLIALRREALSPRLFAGVPWSTETVLAHTLARCAELGLVTALLPPESDVDTPADLARLAAALLDSHTPGCPRTRTLLLEWGMLAGRARMRVLTAEAMRRSTSAPSTGSACPAWC